MSLDQHAEYYNLLYQNKDYKKETDYYIEIIKKYNKKGDSLIDLGCGTGKHDYYFQKKGYSVTGVELSRNMFEIAKKTIKNVDFLQGDIRTFSLKKKYDVAVALFNVMGYLNLNDDVLLALKNINKHLEKGGIFLFDCWYGPGVLRDRPKIAIKRTENETIKITRLVEPQLIESENKIEIKSEFYILNKQTNNYSDVINDFFSARYYFIPEIMHFAEETGFELLTNKQLFSDEKMNDSNWYGLFVLRKK